MKKSRTSRQLKEALKAPTVSVQVPLPMLLSLEMARQSFLDVYISAGLEVLARGMEEDRTALGGAKETHDSERQAVRWGKTPRAVTEVPGTADPVPGTADPGTSFDPEARRDRSAWHW